MAFPGSVFQKTIGVVKQKSVKPQKNKLHKTVTGFKKSGVKRLKNDSNREKSADNRVKSADTREKSADNREKTAIKYKDSGGCCKKSGDRL